MTMASKNRFGCDEVVVGYESMGFLLDNQLLSLYSLFNLD